MFTCVCYIYLIYTSIPILTRWNAQHQIFVYNISMVLLKIKQVTFVDFL